jgi:endonuclease/exonuclease/phosphatase family metal-dependent hydrolase
MQTCRFSVLFLAVAFFSSSISKADDVVVGFWNVENLFDTFGDEAHPKAPTIPKEEHATRLANRARVIKDLNADILGVCEVENRRVLRDLVNEPTIKNMGYNYFAVLDETDDRGMDVGLISKRPFLTQSFTVPGFYRGILVCRFNIEGEPLYVIVNHWKSRAGAGKVATNPMRMECAKRVVELVQQVIPAMEGGKKPAIVALGDLNDEDDDASVMHLEKSGMINLFRSVPHPKRWSLAYDNRDEKKVEQNHFDHLFISPELQSNSVLRVVDGSTEVVRKDYHIRRRRLFGEFVDWPADDYGKVIGYSDHFPVRMTIKAEAKK